MAQNSNSLLIYPSPRKMLGVGAGAALFVGAGAWMIVEAWPRGWHGWPLVATGTGALLFFGAALSYAILRVLRPRPSLVVNEQGITEQGSLLRAGFIPWNEITSIRGYLLAGQPVLGIELRDTGGFLARHAWWRRAAFRFNVRVLGGAPVNVPEIALPGTVADALEQITSRFDVPPRVAGA